MHPLDEPAEERSLRRRCILLAAPSAPGLFLAAIARQARQRQWRIHTDLLHTGIIPTKWRGAGIISYASMSADLTESLSDGKIPLVTVNTSGECRAFPRVQPDHVAIGRLAARHLLEQECREFIWAPFADDAANRDRLLGFRSELRAHGLEPLRLPPTHRRIGHTWYDNYVEWQRSTLAQLRGRRARTGLFAFNDCLAAKVMAEAADAGVAVPEQLAILGVGDEIVETSASPVSLTTIDLDWDSLTACAAELLDRLMAAGSCSERVVTCPPRGVIVRDSTRGFRAETGRLDQATAYILDHHADPQLSVGVVADRIGVSRRQLERDFRSLKGCTVRSYVEELRLQEAARLLTAQPDSKILAVAQAVGMADPNTFFRKFRQKFGTTPAAFRRQVR